MPTRERIIEEALTLFAENGYDGTGVERIAVRAVVEMAGIKDIRTKALRSRNQRNVVNATINGLAALKDAAEVAALRGKTVAEIKG